MHDQAGGDTERIQSIPRVQVWKTRVFIAVRSPDFWGVGSRGWFWCTAQPGCQRSEMGKGSGCVEGACRADIALNRPQGGVSKHHKASVLCPVK